MPAPMPHSKRPFMRLSSSAASSATRTGCHKRQDVDERTHANILGPLRRRAEETAGTWAFGETHVEVVLGDKVKIHAGLVGEF